MYQLKSSGGEISIRPRVRWVVGLNVVWAIVSEYVVYREEFLFEPVWFCVCDSVSEINTVNYFSFLLCYGVAVVEVVGHFEVFPVVFQSDSENVPNF